MLHEIGRELEAFILAKGCPFRVRDREALKPTEWRNVIVIEHDADTFGPARSQSYNPRRHWTRNIGAKITIYAKSPQSGAVEFEHRRVAEQVLDQVLVALRHIAARRKIGLAIGAGKFATVAALESSDRQGGAVYELAVSFERGVAEVTWVGASAPTVTLQSFDMTGSPDLAFDADEGTVTRSAGSWLADGFAAGMQVVIYGTSLNDGAWTIASLDADALTLTGVPLVDEVAAGASVRAGIAITSTTRVIRANAPDDPTPPETACGA
jgi:hypothetical protein